jgi:DmsE family decaheme c-type cytochrome
MSQPRFALLAAASAFVLAVAMSAAGREGPAGVPPMAHAAAPAPPAPQAAQAAPEVALVGSDTCLACHFDMERGVAGTAHGNPAIPGSPAAADGCESCHGPGERHIEDPTVETSIRKFPLMAPREASEACLSCHTGASHALWEGSAHDARNLSCTTCHSVHDPQSPHAQLKTATELETCADCHRTQALKVRRISHMPLVEGKMACSSCHDPHGSTNVKQLRVGNWINESCVSCHTEKRGPFLFEHAAGRESCVSCHDPHGSSNDRMLVSRPPMLCQRCHIGSRHPSTIYDDVSAAERSNRLVGRACVNCHQQIHGSNHPSGQSLTR